MSKVFLPLAILLSVSACGPQPPQVSASLPPDAILGAGDPLRSAAANTSVVFGSPQQLAGRPAEAARAVAQMEYLAVQIPNNPRFPGVSPTVESQFVAARREWRGALGIPAEQPPQAVIESLYAASRALQAGQKDAAAAALPAHVFPQGGQTALLRLASLPRLPLTNDAAVAASQTLQRSEAGRGRF
ncbi:hypothetical protein [Dankookia sp. P2]|uniref:hypothetical protein n=1 Tax=Dankookia sp. P2 TaxID=3423955 RepID=UPI003D67616F